MQVSMLTPVLSSLPNSSFMLGFLLIAYSINSLPYSNWVSIYTGHQYVINQNRYQCLHL